MKRSPLWVFVLFVLAVLVVVVPLARRKTTTGLAPDHARAASSPEVPAATRPVPPPAIVPTVVDAGHDEAVDAGADAHTIAAADASPAAWPEAVKSVLHVGDSSLGYEQGLALEMGKRFKTISVHYFPETHTNAALHSFATSRTLEQLVGARKPDVVLITLGMNNLTVANPEEYARDVRSLVEQVGGRPCWWIGPLRMTRPDNGLVAMLARTTGPCRWASSYDLVIERQPDAIHPTQRGAAKWADAIWTAIGAPPLPLAPSP